MAITAAFLEILVLHRLQGRGSMCRCRSSVNILMNTFTELLIQNWSLLLTSRLCFRGRQVRTKLGLRNTSTNFLDLVPEMFR